MVFSLTFYDEQSTNMSAYIKKFLKYFSVHIGEKKSPKICSFSKHRVIVENFFHFKKLKTKVVVENLKFFNE